MKLKLLLILILVGISVIPSHGQIQIVVDPTKEIKEISPYIYGKNNSLSGNPSEPVSAAKWQLYKDAGVKIFRESGGNNSTKYNWRKKLSSHPDWYNNVYANNWDYSAQSLRTNMPDAKGMWAFQLLGYVAKTNAYNFNEWEYNRAQWWTGVTNNWCGGGGPGLGDGNPNLYLESWPADSTVAILTHWFDSLGFKKEQFQYWNMDNEPECWHSTHDDIMPQAIPAENYIQKYVAVASKARALFPEIKIVGPVFTNEWFWYNWQNGTVPDLQNPSKRYSWVEYFIKRISEEQKRTGLRLLDVLDFHFYPEVNQTVRRDVTLQLYRVFYDTTYDYPGANGCKVINGGWDNNITKEYIFKRSNDWLNQYMGANHGVNMGVTEMGGLYSQDPNVIAVGYASLLGTFAENNVEVFTPWDWEIGQWEVLHLFTNYTGNIAVNSTSSQNNLVSAYSSLNAGKDMLSIVLVNRDINNQQSVTVTLQNVTSYMRSVSYYRLSNLPLNQETFISKEKNALQTGSVDVNKTGERDVLSLYLPKLSVTVLRIPVGSGSGITQVRKSEILIYPNPAKDRVIVETSGIEGPITININDLTGRIIKSSHIENSSQNNTPLEINGLKKGFYVVNITNYNNKFNQKLVVE